MLHHAQRLGEGKALYVRPSVDFIPFLYTPLYPALLAGLSKLLPLGYVLGRVVSVLAFAGALALLVIAAMREARAEDRVGRALGLLIGLAGAGAVAAGFDFTGGFYDLVRGDSLLLFLEAGALAAALWGRSLPSAALAAAAMWLAFLTKQTGPLVGVGIGLGMLVANWRRALVYGAICAVTMGVSLLYLVWSSDGWFWTYIFKLHQSHPFRYDTLPLTPALVWRHEWPTLLALFLSTGGLALGRRLRRSDAIVWGAALAGFVAAVIGFATMWAFSNAFIPATYFPVFAATVFTSRLFTHAARSDRAGAAVVGALCALGIAGHNVLAGKPNVVLRVPQPSDHAAAARFLERVRALPGDGFIPFHPWYAVLAGKRPFVHRMGVKDVADALGRPGGLDEALASQRFQWVIVDYKSQPYEWPHLDTRYRAAAELREGFDSVRMFAGAETSPRWVMVPVKDPPPLPAGAQRIADFEAGSFDGWTIEGDAFGRAPSGTAAGLYGRLAADSGRFGPAHTGSLRSHQIVITKPRLSLVVAGPADPSLRVMLVSGPAVARSASPKGAVERIEWDVADLVNQRVVLVVEDRSVTAGIAIDEVVAY